MIVELILTSNVLLIQIVINRKNYFQVKNNYVLPLWIDLFKNRVNP
ncbi:hypothetical protein EZMO1_4966 [Endozoicomonas montiporae CL-33]|uniref:Uncharacterized protein n=1 Tax=Endozoicomonas montiporae CL-33 TaxID=570277 RepID=A0A142BJC2_9GAMM|nr:hypothetical protein EZMO1_4966 [Endozoicomonas montiporae CL-33]